MTGARRALALGAAAAAVALGGCGGGDEPSGPTPAEQRRHPALGPVAVSPAPAPAPAALADPGRLALGVNLASVFNTPTTPPAVLDSTAAAVAGAGIRLGRTDAYWQHTEFAPPGPDGRRRYDWTLNDRIATALARHEIEWWAVLDYAPGWAAVDPGLLHSPPRDPADFAAYAAAFARRYGPDGEFWRAHPELVPRYVRNVEVWNEPDSVAFWAPRPEPRRYAALYRATRAAVRAATPGIDVFVGGLANPPPFLARLAGLLRAAEIDGIAVHAYDPPERVLERLREARAAARAAGLGDPPMPLTEFGWHDVLTDRTDFALDPRRARNLRQTVAAVARAGCGTPVAIPFTWSAVAEDFVGGYELDAGESRQALEALATAPPRRVRRDRARCP